MVRKPPQHGHGEARNGEAGNLWLPEQPLQVHGQADSTGANREHARSFGDGREAIFPELGASASCRDAGSRCVAVEDAGEAARIDGGAEVAQME
eukprot:1417988-Pleurochrysis_carterae.AAC.1